jgi:hypothetical protein
MERAEFVLGVTGHRDLTSDSAEFACTEIRDFFSVLRDLLPDTPIRLVSGLAEGADRLVTEVALAEGISVDAVVPMPLDHYKSDFSADAFSELESILQSEDVRLIEIPLPSEEIIAEIAEPGPARDQSYERLSNEISRRCHLLISLWDGLSKDLEGGTAYTTTRFICRSGTDTGNFEFLNEMPEGALSDGYAFWVPVGRESHNGEKAQNNSCYLAGILGSRLFVDQNEMPAELEQELQYLNEYNRVFLELRGGDHLQSAWGLFDSIGDADVEKRMPELEPIELEYRKADAMAVYFQGLSDRLFLIYSILAGVMGFAFLVYAKVYASAIFILIYIGIFVLGFLSFRWAHKRHWFSKHLMYRLVAEALRAKFYLALAGHHGALSAAEFIRTTRISNFSGFNWIVHAFRAAEPAVPLRQTASEADTEWLGLAKKCWIEDQSRYFKGKTHVLHHSHERVEKIKSVLLIGLFASGVLLLFFKAQMVEATIVGDFSIKTLLLFLMGLLPLWLGIWEIYANKMATKELAWQYANQAKLFAQAELRMASAKDDDGRRQVLSDLARDSLSETYMWIVQRYHREHEPPSAG